MTTQFYNCTYLIELKLVAYLKLSLDKRKARILTPKHKVQELLCWNPPSESRVEDMHFELITSDVRVKAHE